MAAKLKPYDLIISADGKDIRDFDLSLQSFLIHLLYVHLVS